MSNMGQVAHNTDTQSQRCHYDKIAAAYVANLAYPHTRGNRSLSQMSSGFGDGLMVDALAGAGKSVGDV